MERMFKTGVCAIRLQKLYNAPGDDRPTYLASDIATHEFGGPT